MKFIAVDIGASSGRVIQFSLSQKKLQMKEIHRFKNQIIFTNKKALWDLEYLVNEVFIGLELCSNVCSIGIDTWGVDYVSLKNNELEDYSYSYRDKRTHNKNSYFDKRDLFYKTGVGFLPFNTIYQLENAKTLSGEFLMVPDYLNYCLTNVISNEITNAITTQLVNIDTQDFDNELLNKLNHNLKFNKPTQLKSWPLSKTSQVKLGYNCDVIQVASHDSASAFIGSIALNDGIIISLGTWSIVGCLVDKPIINDFVVENDFSNEGSLFNKYRFQKNTMGMWMFESLKKELNDLRTYQDIIKGVSNSLCVEIIDVDASEFLAPTSMKEAIDSYFEKNCKTKLQTNDDYYKVIFDSMIEKYIEIIRNIELATNKEYGIINVVGGGSQNEYLMETLSTTLKKKIVAGPVEATALGNVACQLLVKNEIKTLDEFKEVILNSTMIKEYEV